MPSPANIFKSIYATCLLIFSIVSVMGLIATRQSTLSNNVNPATAFIVIWVAIIWLSMVEGGQGSLVGLQPIQFDLYKDSHPITYLSTKVAFNGDNLDRYLLGRQFMVCLVVFIVNISGGPIGGAELWGYPDWVKNVFFTTGFAMILFTCQVGQLASQVNGSLNMLDYINNYGCLITFWTAMLLEFSGLLHSSYLVQYLVSAISGKKIESNEPPRTALQGLWYWFRCLYSLAILCFCFAVTLVALFDGKTTMWKGVPSWLAMIIFFILMSVVGMLEGMQIAFFAVAKFTPEERGDSKFQKMTCQLLFKGDGKNLPGFMIGRQLMVVSCMFFIARVTSVSIPEGGSNIFDVPDGVQEFFNTGLLGALITTIVASIAWQLVASAFPLAFLANPITYIFLRICLLFEASGICHGAWVLAAIQKKAWGFQRDEVYIGTAEERAKMNKGDDTAQSHVGVGHIAKLPNFVQNAPQSLKDLLEKDPSVGTYINSIYDDLEKN